MGLINPKTQVWLIGHAEIEVYSSETVFFAVSLPISNPLIIP